jgi:protein-L-isoaspartate(D-aspartate) O-methyltransferase
MFDFAQARTNMVDNQLRPNGITDGRILDAMQLIAREDFVGEGEREIAYMDGDVPLRAAESPRFLIEPMAFARMVHAAEIRESDRVLIIGAATGYGALVLSKLARHVVAVEEDAVLFSNATQNLNGVVNVSLTAGALADGAKNLGPYDVILIEGSVQNVPESLFLQLNLTGRVVAAVGNAAMAKCTIYTGQGEMRSQRSAFDISIATLPTLGKPRTGFAF